MSTKSSRLRQLVWLLSPVVAVPAMGEVYYSKKSFVDNSTGYVQSEVDGSWWRGSGVIARDPRLIYSCGHVFYENGEWATRYVFHRAYDSQTSPNPDDGAVPRGFRYFTSYANNVDQYGTASWHSFAYDFTIMYGNDSFGTAVGWWTDGAVVLQSNRWKRIVGYPSSIDYTGASGHAYQHATDWFSLEASQESGQYYTFDGASTGGGNSGGPVFVYDDASEKSFLAAILVAGTSDTAGVYALGEASHTMGSNALGLKSTTKQFGNTSPLILPDNTTSYSTRSTNVTGFSDNVTALKFSVSITTPQRGDLDVYLKSPSGRIRWIKKHSASDSANNLSVNAANYSTQFKGYAANGSWKLKMRDYFKVDRATFQDFNIQITALAE